ncbi:MAG: membrane protein insertase YidC, partial [Phycisphaerales bacterium]|nr:membrane protein insertase YidC [Phycisphaerales bacterium]
MRLGFNQSCAVVLELALARHFQGVEPGSPHEVLQQTQEHDGKSLVPFALLEVTINDQSVKLAGVYLDGAGKPAGYDWKQAAPGVFVAEIMDATGKDVARVSRTFRLVQGLYEFTVETAFENLTAVPMTVRFTETGPVELPIGVIRYGGDPRRARFGLVSGSDTQDVSGRTPLMRRDQMLGSMPGGSWGPLTVWPTEQTAPHGEALSWFGLTNRFFAVTVHALPSPEPAHTGAPAPNADKRLTGVAQIDRIVLARGPDKKGQFEANAAGALRTLSPVVAVPGGGAHRVSVGVYAGPIDREPLASADKADGRIGLTDLEIYFWPGPCSFCTFQPVAYFLRWVLSIFADYVVFDWALAIILLVVCVRTALHPVTKWSQISLQRFGKQMQKVAPKQKVLQEKFKDDPARLRQEMAALMREENVNYAGMLGCLPMFLQTPVWIALSSMMFFLFDLRHTPAFFGVIQKLTGGNWQFLADLAEPDRFIRLPFSFNVPLMNEIDSVNILPVVLGTVFFIQQKYMTPPPTAQLSPEMEMQQKIMKVLIVFMFPIMMYNAPSGLALYFITNSTLGILESRHIRRAFEKQEAQREELRKRNPHAFDKRAEPGFIARFQARIAEAQARAEQVKAQHSRHGPRKPGE